jgi:hypothetical protein
VEQDRIAAAGGLSERALTFLGQSLQQVYRVDESGYFADLLRAIDAAEYRCATPSGQAAAAPKIS